MILDERLDADLMPVRSGGITLYRANELKVIFAWAERNSRSLEWVEGAFYNPNSDRGQLSLSYMRECGPDYAAFKAECLSLVPEMEAEAATIGLSAYFEIGISELTNGN